VTLAWDQTQVTDLAGYNIYYRTCAAGSGCTGIGAASDLSGLVVPLGNLANSSAPRYRVEGLPAESDFVFVVTAYTDAGQESGYSNTAIYRAPVTSPDDGGSDVDETPPSVPTQLNGTVQTSTSATSIVLNWADSTDDVGVSAYIVNRDGVAIGSVTNSAYTDGDVTAGSSYEYTVVATDAAGNQSAASQPLTLAVPAAEPTPTTPPPASDGSQPLSVTIDDDDDGATSQGLWKRSSMKDNYGSQSFYSRDLGATYSYATALSGRYDVDIWWTQYRSRCKSVPIEIYDDNELIDTIAVSQRTDGGQWNYVGTYDFDGVAKVVVVADNSACSTSADAVEFTLNEDTTPTPTSDSTDNTSVTEVVIDDNDAGTTKSGTWKVSGGQNPYGNQSLYSREVGASYSYSAAISGSHEVELWWTPHKSRCSSVPVEVYDGQNFLGRVQVNQRKNGSQWYSIGTYDFSGQARLVVISDDSGCSTCADAVRLVK
jgi:hypothetical protein